jgi:hypothetical protein
LESHSRGRAVEHTERGILSVPEMYCAVAAHIVFDANAKILNRNHRRTSGSEGSAVRRINAVRQQHLIGWSLRGKIVFLPAHSAPLDKRNDALFHRTFSRDPDIESEQLRFVPMYIPMVFANRKRRTTKRFRIFKFIPQPGTLQHIVPAVGKVPLCEKTPRKQIIVVGIGIQRQKHIDLPDSAETTAAESLFPDGIQHGQKHTRKNRYYGNTNQKLYQRKSPDKNRGQPT